MFSLRLLMNPVNVFKFDEPKSEEDIPIDMKFEAGV